MTGSSQPGRRDLDRGPAAKCSCRMTGGSRGTQTRLSFTPFARRENHDRVYGRALPGQKDFAHETAWKYTDLHAYLIGRSHGETR
jgi:hypothetical protein